MHNNSFYDAFGLQTFVLILHLICKVNVWKCKKELYICYCVNVRIPHITFPTRFRTVNSSTC